MWIELLIELYVAESVLQTQFVVLDVLNARYVACVFEEITFVEDSWVWLVLTLYHGVLEHVGGARLACLEWILVVVEGFDAS